VEDVDMNGLGRYRVVVVTLVPTGLNIGSAPMSLLVTRSNGLVDHDVPMGEYCRDDNGTSLEKLIIVPLKTYHQSGLSGPSFHDFLRDMCRPTDEEVRIPRIYLQSEIQDRVLSCISA
jgi:hypothetical protein